MCLPTVGDMEGVDACGVVEVGDAQEAARVGGAYQGVVGVEAERSHAVAACLDAEHLDRERSQKGSKVFKQQMCAAQEPLF